MSIITIAQEEYLHGIPFSDFASAKGALVVFGEGITPLSDATHQRLIADGYGYCVRPGQDLKGFIEPVFAEMDSHLKISPSYTRNFVDDGFGPFVRTTIGVDRTADDCYILSLYSAYSDIGKKVEDGLASGIGMPQALRWSRVNVVHSPAWHGGFEIDFDPIARGLAGAGYGHMDGAMIAEAIVASARRGPLSVHTGRCIVAERAARNLGVSVALDAMTIATSIRSTLVADGSIVRGRVQSDRVDQARRKFPTVHIVVDGEPAASETGWQDLPIVDQTTQEEVRQLTARIASSLKP
jgi:hypothetical protein